MYWFAENHAIFFINDIISKLDSSNQFFISYYESVHLTKKYSEIALISHHSKPFNDLNLKLFFLLILKFF
jgi:hypothetical protein